MATVIISGFIYALPGLDGHASFYFNDSSDMDEHGWVRVCPHEIKVEVPSDFDLLAGHAGALTLRKQRAQEELARVDLELSLLADSPRAAA